MANYDDIFNASAQKGTEDKSFVSFNKEEWAAAASSSPIWMCRHDSTATLWAMRF